MARDTNFYYSFLVLPAEKRRAIVAVWDFCRAVDDAVDEAVDEEAARAETAGWRRELAACFEGGAPQTPQGRALAPLVREFNLPRASFDALIEGVEMDIGARRYETFADLYEYCIRVASAVGLICLEIFGYRNPRARQYATNLGVALQLTNILRDVPEDLARGRVYVPQEDLRRHGCTEADLSCEVRQAGRGVKSAAVRAMLKQQADRAHRYYRQAAAVLPHEDARQLVAAEIMGAIYRAILGRIERADYDVFTRTVRIPRPERALIALGVWAQTAIGLRGRESPAPTR
ncbi:MAG: squalene synthase HpnD [Acidobacteria bacterium RIFCSPLOWO2_02_FULL_67_36]|nr:MAG: squalene synthase HpnD [Acidobacteria bacterium RIFCSPLOWO2_02_FULL_67_36]OFW23063.1 MAG: squalene synthase HpnD [Acidobacteria bacterium RIFCSPLOWO2_12_FULL_66_21]